MPEYLAPEVIANSGHGQAVDFWALGILLYALFTGGVTPFASPGDDELTIYHKISAKKYELHANVPPVAADLISRLLQPNPLKRLGYGPAGIAGLKRHPWFSTLLWDDLYIQQMPIPPGLRQRIVAFEGVAVADFDPKAPERDPTWIKDF